MSDRDEQRNKSVDWSFLKIIITILLYTLGTYYIYQGIVPIIQGWATGKEYAFISFVILIILSMISIFWVSTNGRFYVWAGAFGLVLYSSTMFWFYETLAL